MKSIMIISLLFSALSFADWSAEKEFKTNCATCHSLGHGEVNEKGQKMQGPDLGSVHKRREIGWLVKFIQYPSGMIEGDADEPGYEKPDPLAKAVYELYKPVMMAEQELDEKQIKAVIEYIKAQKKESKGKITTLDKKAAKPAAKKKS